jgi:hypothetical protein
MGLYLSDSPARRVFKSQLGNANHLIITSLVGLDAVERQIVTEIPADIHAAWSPKDPIASARRSRRLILDMALVRAVDALDIYIRHSNRKPFLIEDSALRDKINAAGRRVFMKFKAILDYHPCLDPVLCALVEVMLIWRNKSAHDEADVEIADSVKYILREHRTHILDNYKGLDSELLISGYENNRPPTFKEIASFIHATQDFVCALDNLQLGTCQPERFLREHIWQITGKSVQQLQTLDAHRKAQLQSVWGKDVSERKDAVVRFLLRSGLAPHPAKDRKSYITFDESLLDRVGSMKPSAVYAWAKPS